MNLSDFNHTMKVGILPGLLLMIGVLDQTAEAAVIEGAGEIQAAQTFDIQSEIDQPSRILFMAPNGEMVREGQLLVELDVVPLENELRKHEIRLSRLHAVVETQAYRLEVIKEGVEAEVKRAEMFLQVVGLKKERVLGADGELDMKKRQLKREVELIGERMDGLEQLSSLAQTQFQSGRGDGIKATEYSIALAETRVAMMNTREALEFLDRYERPQIVSELELEITRAEAELNHARLDSRLQVLQAEAEFDAARADLEIGKEELEIARERLAMTRVYAPADGKVIIPPGSRGAPALGEGSQVRPGATLLRIADLSRFVVVVPIRQAQGVDVQPGQLARVTVDAYPDRTLEGEVLSVVSVSASPDNRRSLSRMVIGLREPELPLRPGMTSRVIVDTATEQY